MFSLTNKKCNKNFLDFFSAHGFNKKNKALSMLVIIVFILVWYILGLYTKYIWIFFKHYSRFYIYIYIYAYYYCLTNFLPSVFNDIEKLLLAA